MRLLSVALLLSSFPAIVGAQGVIAQNDQSVKPWQFSESDRIAARSDVVKAAERVQEARQSPRSGRIASNAVSVMAGDVIDGRRHPELFMPIELFRLFVNGAFVANSEGRAVYRKAREQMATGPLPDGFWTDTGQVTRTYVNEMTAIQELNEAIGAATDPQRASLRAKSASLRRELCRDLAVALTKTEERFGRTWFERFLYESVAPTAVITLQSPSTPTELHYVTGGCQ